MTRRAMPAADFATWLDARFRTDVEAAAWFGCTPPAISMKRSGKRPVTERELRQMAEFRGPLLNDINSDQ